MIRTAGATSTYGREALGRDSAAGRRSPAPPRRRGVTAAPPARPARAGRTDGGELPIGTRSARLVGGGQLLHRLVHGDRSARGAAGTAGPSGPWVLDDSATCRAGLPVLISATIVADGRAAAGDRRSSCRRRSRRRRRRTRSARRCEVSDRTRSAARSGSFVHLATAVADAAVVRRGSGVAPAVTTGACMHADVVGAQELG